MSDKSISSSPSSIADSLKISQKIKQTGFHSIIYGFGSVAQSAVQFLLIPILTALLPVEKIGAYYLLQMISLVAGAVFYLGVTSAFPRSYYDYSLEEDQKVIFSTALFILGIGAGFQILIGLCFSRNISIILLHTPEYSSEVLWALISSALSFINQFFFLYLRVQKKSIFSVSLSLVSLILSLVIIFFLLKADGHDLTAPFKGTALAQLLIGVAFVLSVGRRMIVRKVSSKEITLILRFGLPTVLSSLAGLGLDWADRILIERYLSISDVGIYSIATKLGSLINVVFIVPFSQVFSLAMVEYRKSKYVDALFSKVYSFYFVAGGAIIILVATYIKDILPYIARGRSYSNISPIIILAMTSYLIYGTINILNAGLVFERKIITGTLVLIFFAILKVMINFFIIPRFGILGASSVALFISLCIPLAIYSQAKKYFCIKFERGRLFKLALFYILFIFYFTFFAPLFSLGIIGKTVSLVCGFTVFSFLCINATERRQIYQVIYKKYHDE